jgi:hypothetical protein
MPPLYLYDSQGFAFIDTFFFILLLLGFCLTNGGSWKKISRFRILALLVGRHQPNIDPLIHRDEYYGGRACRSQHHAANYL